MLLPLLLNNMMSEAGTAPPPVINTSGGGGREEAITYRERDFEKQRRLQLQTEDEEVLIIIQSFLCL